MSRVFRVAAVYYVLLLGLRATGSVSEADSISFSGLQARLTQYVLDYVLRSSIVQQALDYANQKAMDSLATQIPKTEIPEQSGKSNHMHYSLKNVRITGFTKPSSSIKVDPNTGLAWSAGNAGISLHGDWRVKWHKISTSGSVDVSVSGVSFSITVAASRNPSSGTLSIKPGACSCNVGGVNVHVHGKLKKVLDLFRHTVEKRIRDLIPGKLCQAVNQQVSQRADSVLEKVNEAYGVATTVAVVLCVAIVVAIIVAILMLWCLSRIFSLAVILLVGGTVTSVLLYWIVTRAQDAVPEILDYLFTLMS